MLEAWRRALSEKDHQRSLQVAFLIKETAFQTGDFTFNSGLKSPMKIDTDVLRNDKEAHRRVSEYLAEAIMLTLPEGERPNVVVGVITGGVSFAREVADILKARMVRSAARLGNTDTPEKRRRVEGWILEGDRVVIIEDVVTTGANTLACARQVRAEGGIVKLTTSIFDYDFEIARQALADEGLSRYALTNFKPFLKLLDDEGLVHRLKNWHDLAPYYFQKLQRQSQ